MKPVLVRIPEWVPLFGDQAITSFGAMLLVAFLVGGRVLSAGLARRGVDRSLAWELVVAAAVAGLVGAKLYYILSHLGDAREDFWGVLGSRGGTVWYGGLIAGAAAVAAVTRARKVSFRLVADAAAPALALGYALGRIGCFLVGDDYGLPTASDLGVSFPQGMPPTTWQNLEAYFGIPVPPAERGAIGYVRVWPTQLFEAFFSFALFAFLVRLDRNSATRARSAADSGRIFATWLVASSVLRLAVEFLRAKDDRMLGGFTVAQLLSVLLVSAGFALYSRWS